MGKTKKLAEELTENERLPETLEPTNAPRVIKMKGLTNELTTQIVGYLETRPYGEVKGLLNSLSQAPILDVTVTG